MEPKSKLIATASCKGQGSCRGSGNMMIDRFSDFPDQVAHYILSFLAITDLTRFSCVSKRCRELYFSTPSLDFDGFSDGVTSTSNKRTSLLSSLDRFFIRRANNKIQRLRIRWSDYLSLLSKESFCEDEKFRMMMWIHNAVRCNVEELDLEISIFAVTPPFPSSVFLCGSLTSLVVDMNCTILKAPSLNCLSNLRVLELRNVLIADEGFFKWISRSCKCIKELQLERIYGLKDVTIESSSLESFGFVSPRLIDVCHLNISGEKLRDILIDWRFDSPSNKSLNVFAPNLKYLYWVGNLMNHPSLGLLEYLEEAGVFLEPKLDGFDNVVEVHCSFRRVKVLILNEETIKALFREGFILAPLYDICFLRMDVGSFVDDLVPAMVCLLRGTPNLRTLYIKSNPPFLDHKSNTGFSRGYWKQQNLAFTGQLKDLTIELCNGSNGIELARYILKHAQNLDKMVIIYLPQQSNVVRKLNKSKKISNATVVFQEYQR